MGIGGFVSLNNGLFLGRQHIDIDDYRAPSNANYGLLFVLVDIDDLLLVFFL